MHKRSLVSALGLHGAAQIPTSGSWSRWLLWLIACVLVLVMSSMRVLAVVVILAAFAIQGHELFQLTRGVLS